jgi:hypothetical protein
MKTTIKILLMVFVLTVSCRTFAQDKVYKDGSVWAVSFVKVNSNMGDEYLKNLKNTWNAVHTEAVKQGLILSFKVLSGKAANPEDWDIMLMSEYKNLASVEGNEDKWDAIYKKVVGDEATMKKLNESRSSMRTIFGDKLLREVVYN